MENNRILIAGAGPAGLTAALTLARRGILARIIDKASGPSELSRAVGIFPKTLDRLPLEVVTRLIEESEVIGKARIHKGTQPLLELSFSGEADKKLLGYPQDKTENILREDFERNGGIVEYGVEFDGLTQDDICVRATLNGTEHEFDYVIGTDGSNSVVREAIGLEHVGFTLPEKWSIADFHADGLDHNLNIWLLNQGTFAGYVPIGPDRYRLFTSTEHALSTVPIDINVTKINRESAFSIGVRRVERFGVGRVFLAGDAAHIHTPVGGKGMNLAMQDATELAHRLADNKMAGYSESRHKEAAKVAAFTERMRFLWSTKNPVIPIVRNTAFHAINRVDFLKARVAHAFMAL